MKAAKKNGKAKIRNRRRLDQTAPEIARLPPAEVRRLARRLQRRVIRLEAQRKAFPRRQPPRNRSKISAEAARKQAEVALRESEERMRFALEATQMGEWEINPGDQTATRSLRHDLIFGYDELQPNWTYRKFLEHVYPADRRAVDQKFRHALRADEDWDFECRIVRRDQAIRWIWASGRSQPGSAGARRRIVGVIRDITARKQEEERIARLNRAQAILAGVDHAIVLIKDRQKLLKEICRLVVEIGGFKLAWIGMVAPDGSIQPVAKAGKIEYLESIRLSSHDVPEGRGPVGTAVRENRHVVVEDIEKDPSMEPWRDRARQFGLRYVAAFPIRTGERVAGGIQVYAPRADFFDEKEVSLLVQVSNDISLALTTMAAVAAREQVERELGDFFDKSPLGLFWVAPGGFILRANRAGLALLGFPETEVIGRSVQRFLGDSEATGALLEQLSQGKTIRDFRARLQQPDGTVKHVMIDANGLWTDKHLVHFRWFVQDITRRVELEREILAVSEREQLRLGQDLHDDLCQQLAGVQFMSDGLARDLQDSGHAGAAAAVQIAQSARQAVNHSRDLARGLSPVRLEAEGLMDSLRTLAERITTVFRRCCQFHCPTPILVPDHNAGIHLYRIAQEAVSNAIKHGKAGRIDIELTADGTGIVLAIRDDGTGIKPKPKGRGLGLRIMEYRTGVIGGTLVVQRRPAGGTEVICTVPNGTAPACSGKAK